MTLMKAMLINNCVTEPSGMQVWIAGLCGQMLEVVCSVGSFCLCFISFHGSAQIYLVHFPSRPYGQQKQQKKRPIFPSHKEQTCDCRHCQGHLGCFNRSATWSCHSLLPRHLYSLDSTWQQLRNPNSKPNYNYIKILKVNIAS